VLSVEEWVTIRELAWRKVPVSEIARRTGRDRKTVRKVMSASAPKPHGNAGKNKQGKLDPYREYLLERVDQGCLNGTVLLEEIRRQGYSGGVSILRDLLTPIRREQVRKQEATERFETAPGKQAQVDWGDFGRIWDESEGRWRRLYAFVFTLGYSRAMYLEFTTSCDTEHFLACHLNAFAALGIPEKILYDNLKTATLGRKTDGTPILPARFLDFALMHGFTPSFCKPYRARTKGKVERSVGYVRGNFWVRIAHEVKAGTLELVGVNERATNWICEVANARVHGTHGEVVARRLDEERPLLTALAGRPRFDTDYHSIRRVGRDGRLSYDGVIHQVELTEALTAVDVYESLSGQITIRAKDGRVLTARSDHSRPKSTTSASGSPIHAVNAPSDCEPKDSTALRLIIGDAPDVQTRDLARYEEVALAVAAG
jgi:transposase